MLGGYAQYSPLVLALLAGLALLVLGRLRFPIQIQGCIADHPNRPIVRQFIMVKPTTPVSQGYNRLNKRCAHLHFGPNMKLGQCPAEALLKFLMYQWHLTLIWHLTVINT